MSARGWRLPAAVVPILLFAALAGQPRPAGAQQVECDRDGSPAEVRSLAFVGNTTFSDDQLSTFVVTTPSSFTRRHFRIFGAKRCYPVDGLAPDVAALKALYRNNGFYETKVDTVVKALSKTAVAITFRINEGLPLVLDSLTITGVDSVANRAAIMRDLPLRVGGRFGIVLLVTEGDSIVARLANSGYPHADVFRSYQADSINHHASVDLQIVTGAHARFGTIAVTSANAAVTGPGEIDSSVVLRLLGFRTGQNYSDAALTDGQRNLYNLGAYRHVGLEVDTTWQHGDSVADVNVDLREDYLRQYDQTEGWGTLDCFRVTSQYTDKNFLDNAQHLVLTGRVSKLGYGRPTETNQTRNLCYRPTLDRDSVGSSTLNYYAGATLTEPTLFGYHWVPSYSLYSERRGEYLAYLRATDIGVGASATRSISFDTPLRLGYTLELGHTRAEPAVLCFVFGRCRPDEQEEVQQRQRLGILSALLQRTRVDNLVAPTTGYNGAFEIRGSAPKLTGSDTALSFLKGTGDISWYASLRRNLTVLFRVRGGYIVGGTAGAIDSVRGARLPPPQERLYAGGADNVRGFGQNQLGPLVYTLDASAFTVDSLGPNKDTLEYIAKPGAASRRPIPVGGNALLVLNAELRLRDPFIPDKLEYVPFLDAGQVWTRGSATDLDYRRLEVTPGLGIRYFSPVGPVKISAGYNPYASRPGPAYFPRPVDPLTGKAPLICVTAPGTAPLKVIRDVKTGELTQDAAACPATFHPFIGSGFFSHLTWNFSIGTDF